jgi:hypothetical protein
MRIPRRRCGRGSRSGLVRLHHRLDHAADLSADGGDPGDQRPLDGAWDSREFVPALPELAAASHRGAAVHRKYDQYRSRPQRDGRCDQTPDRRSRIALRRRIRDDLRRRHRVHQLRPLRLCVEMDDAELVSLCCGAVCRTRALGGRARRSVRAADHVERRVLHHACRHPGHHDLALPFLLASLAGSGRRADEPTERTIGASAEAGH